MSFNVAAESYDNFMGLWSRGLSRQLIEFAGVAHGQAVIDVGCGPGGLTTELAALLGSGAVAAVDPSESFVLAARERVPGADIRVADAEHLPFSDHTFDAALAQLVVHFMSDPVAGLAEMGRVTHVGGVVAASVWDFAGGRGPLGPFWEVARELDAEIADESGLAGTGEGQLVELLGAAGLGETVETVFCVEREFSTFEEWWEPFTRGVGPAGSYLAGLTSERQHELRQRCRAALEREPFALSAFAWAARGVA